MLVTLRRWIDKEPFALRYSAARPTLQPGIRGMMLGLLGWSVSPPRTVLSSWRRCARPCGVDLRLGQMTRLNADGRARVSLVVGMDSELHYHLLLSVEQPGRLRRLYPESDDQTVKR